MSMTEQGMQVAAKAERCARCHEFHGPGWGAKECARHARIFVRLAKRQASFRRRHRYES